MFAFCSSVFALAGYARYIGKLGKPLVGGFAESLKHYGKYDGVCQPVRHIVHTAKGVGDGVHIAYISPGESHARVVSGELHISSCLEVRPVVVGFL